MVTGPLAFGAVALRRGDAAGVRGGPVEGLDVGRVVDGDDCRYAGLREGSKTVSWRNACDRSGGRPAGTVVKEDCDFTFEVEVGWRHSVTDED